MSIMFWISNLAGKIRKIDDIIDMKAKRQIMMHNRLFWVD